MQPLETNTPRYQVECIVTLSVTVVIRRPTITKSKPPDFVRPERRRNLRLPSNCRSGVESSLSGGLIVGPYRLRLACTVEFHCSMQL